MEFNHLPMVDWKLAMKLAGNNQELAEDIFNLTLKNLPQELLSIKQSHFVQNYSELLGQVHKLHGALCYCGFPRLKTLVATLETDLKNNIMDNLPLLLDRLNTEVNLLLERYSS